MKKVLIISYCYPPDSSVCSLRAKGLAKYLKDYGWEPIVLTRNLPDDKNANSKTIKTQFLNYNSLSLFKKKSNENIKKVLTNKSTNKNKRSFRIKMYNFLTEIIAYPDVQRNWTKDATYSGEIYLKQEKIDAIISTSSPLTCHLVAYKLSSSTNIPWIADLRDLWTQNHNYSYSFLRKYFENKLELKTLSKAQVLTTVSEPLSKKLIALHKKERVYSIPNGFDPDDLNTLDSFDNKFRITYTGTIYIGKQSPEPLFKAIHELILQQILNYEDLSIEFYGHNHEWLSEYIKKYEIENIVHLNGYVSRKEAIEVQRRSQLLLLLNWNDPKESEGIYTGKIFDYLASRRPILSIGNNGGVIKELLNTTSAGIYASNVYEIKEEIIRSYEEFKREGSVQYKGQTFEINKYSYREMARKFSEILDKL